MSTLTLIPGKMYSNLENLNGLRFAAFMASAVNKNKLQDENTIQVLDADAYKLAKQDESKAQQKIIDAYTVLDELLKSNKMYAGETLDTVGRDSVYYAEFPLKRHDDGASITIPSFESDFETNIDTRLHSINVPADSLFMYIKRFEYLTQHKEEYSSTFTKHCVHVFLFDKTEVIFRQSNLQFLMNAE